MAGVFHQRESHAAMTAVDWNADYFDLPKEFVGKKRFRTLCRCCLFSNSQKNGQPFVKGFRMVPGKHPLATMYSFFGMSILLWQEKFQKMPLGHRLNHFANWILRKGMTRPAILMQFHFGMMLTNYTCLDKSESSIA